MTEGNSFNHGGKRKGAGRPAKIETRTSEIVESALQLRQEMDGGLTRIAESFDDLISSELALATSDDENDSTRDKMSARHYLIDLLVRFAPDETKRKSGVEEFLERVAERAAKLQRLAQGDITATVDGDDPRDTDISGNFRALPSTDGSAGETGQD